MEGAAVLLLTLWREAIEFHTALPDDVQPNAWFAIPDHDLITLDLAQLHVNCHIQ